LDEESVIYLGATLGFTVFALEGIQMLHSDLKPDNVALTEDGVSVRCGHAA
jgi:Ser/Thr protein kinase RdoA (MazF antagonist)